MRTTNRRVHLPVTWALCRIDQVSVSSTLVTPYTSFSLLTSPSNPCFGHISANFRLSSFFFTSDPNRHFGATSAALSTETEPQDVTVFQVTSLAHRSMYLLALRNGVPLSSPSVSEKFEEGCAFHQVRRNFGSFFKEQHQPRHSRGIASTSTSSASRRYSREETASTLYARSR